MTATITRRDVLKAGGLIVLGGAVGGCATATGINRAVPPAAKLVQGDDQVRTTPADGSAAAGASTPPREKPTWTPKAEDPFAYALADNLFWNDIMMEHAVFFQQLMPGKELDAPRSQAAEFERAFAQQLERSRGLTPDGYVAFNRSTIELLKRFSDYKKDLRERQASGKIHSLVWPLFFQHTAREADRFASRLELYNRKQIEFERAELVDFWAKTMGEHSAFIAHLLDPDERLLIDQANKLEKSFLREGFREVRGDEVMKAAKEVLDFKTVGEKGIYAGKIKSIISPPLASHVRREAVKFVDELQRARAA
jgi:hypothetical protein